MKSIKTMMAISMLAAMAGAAQAALYDRGGGMIYDSTQNVTWLQNTNLGGNLNSADAEWWARDLVYGGYSDWRLPSGKIIYSADGCITYNGFCSAGWNYTQSELGHLFYVDLGNKGQFDTN